MTGAAKWNSPRELGGGAGGKQMGTKKLENNGTTQKSQSQVADIRRTLAVYHPDGTTFELCGIGTDRYPKAVDGGFFDDREKAVEAACKLTRDHHAVYITINPVDAALLSRANNRIKSGLARTQDKEVPRLPRLLIDADPVRPSGTNSTNQEHDTAIELCGRIKADLGALGWPEPLVADSGNGGHLIYCLPDLPNTTETIELLKACLKALAQRYNTGTHHVDETTFNPAQLSKLYGTWARKGDSTPDRPHRLARILSVPDHPDPVSLELLKVLAESVKPGRAADQQPKSAQGKGNGKFDLAAYLERYRVHIKQVKPHGDSILHVLECCLFDETHSGGEAAIGQKSDGILFYFCYHNSCKGRTWEDARQKISGNDRLWQFTESYKQGQKHGDPKDWDVAAELFPRTPFPWHVLPPAIAESLQQLARACASSSDHLPGIAGAILASILGRGLSISPKLGWNEPLILWLADNRPSGEGKTPTARMLMEVIHHAQHAEHQRYKNELAAYEKDLAVFKALTKKQQAATVPQRRTKGG